jgi:hypothetical protein
MRFYFRDFPEREFFNSHKALAPTTPVTRCRELGSECNGDFTTTISRDRANSTAFIDLPVSPT